MSDANANEQRERTPFRYTAALANAIEARWQKYWDEQQTFRAPNPGEQSSQTFRGKFYCLDMFPYPSGAGLHVGHPEGYTATDIISRYKRHRGFNVLHPMGWDAFGLPAEQYAIQTGVHPAITTRKAIDTFRRQLKSFGMSYDWSREVATCDEDFYKWTQWIFLKLYNAWYDVAQAKARPIEELIEELESGERAAAINPDAAEFANDAKTQALPWTQLDDDARRRIIDSYRLAYTARQTVNWCPKLGTALANEEVIDGKSERGGYPVFRKPLTQWMFRITAYAERLLNDLKLCDWPESTRTMQAEWIGRSEGAEVEFPIQGASEKRSSLRVFTTRPDTIFGATFMVVAPEHPLVQTAIDNPQRETDVNALLRYVEQARNRSDVDRMAETTKKTGVFTGIHAINPATGTPIPVWTADYVLMGYGTGAIMAVPGQDQRDWEFAKAFKLPIVRTVQPPKEFDGEAYASDGPAINSANDEVSLNGLIIADAKRAIIDWLERTDRGVRKVNFKLRDWLFSRQRYWGEPFPIVFDAEGRHYPVEASKLPVVLPPLEDYQPVESDDPQPMLAKATEWVNTTAGEAGVSAELLAPETPVTRETNTMPNWAGSCWYYLRYIDPRNGERFVGREAEQYWMVSNKKDGTPHAGGVDLYIGGAEHAVLHLLYARFWHKVLFDLGEVSTPEPFGKLFHQGLILSFAYQRIDKSLVPVDEVMEQQDGSFVEKATNQPVTSIVAKMSKTLKNVHSPDEVIAEYGADTLRLYEMYMGPLEQAKPWNPRDIVGLFRFLQRVWRLAVYEATGALRVAETRDEALERELHRTAARVAHDIDRLSLNTAIAAMIEFVNLASKSAGLTRDQLQRFAVVMSPFAPHLAEELHAKLGHEGTIAFTPWPEVDEGMLIDTQVEVPVQINGKVKGRITVAADADQNAMQQAAIADERLAEFLKGRTIRKVIAVPGKILNLVVTDK
jgi:leucyl-tRNA synthetase